MAASVTHPERALNAIWRVFNSQGVTDDLTIIEYLAFLLLLRHAGLHEDLMAQLQKSPESSNVILSNAQHQLHEYFKGQSGGILPSEPDSIPGHLLREILDNLEAALTNLRPADLLNRRLLFRLPDRLAGGRYPTPRHIARTMASLVNLEEAVSLADLACGSGGLLVTRADIQPLVTGIEISPNWGRIAWTNAVLHDLPTPRIDVRNSLSIDYQAKGAITYNCVLMNPSFGVPVDRAVLQNTPLSRYGTRSETLLTAQALSALSLCGRIAVLLPGGSLFTRSSGELNLRQTMIEDHRLQAVIALNQDAFQPYSTFPTFILLAEKPAQASEPTTVAVWFYRVAADGFTPGRNRQPDPGHNDLPLVEMAVQAQAGDPDHRLSDEDGSPLLEVKRLQGEGEPLGYSFTRQAEGTLTVRRLGSPMPSGAALLAELRNPSPVGYLLVRDGAVCTGLAEPVQISLKLPEPLLPVGHYLLPEEHGDSLIIEEDSVKLNDGKHSHSLEPYADDANDQRICFLVDNEGIVVSTTLTAEASILRTPISPNHATAIPLTLENGEPAGHLIVASTLVVSAVPLAADEGECIHLAEGMTGEMLFLEQENGGLKRVAVLASTTMFTGDKRHQGVAMDLDGSWFGVQVPVAEIRAPTYDLQPSTYFPAEMDERERRSSAELLGDIKTHQRDLQGHIDYLLGMVEMRPIATTHLPPAVESTVQPIGTLTGIQKTLWERLQEYRETFSTGDGAEFPTPRPFQLQQIGDELASGDIQRTLELFERMGLIVQVTYEGAPYYRLVADRDLVKKSVEP